MNKKPWILGTCEKSSRLEESKVVIANIGSQII